jgi:N-acetyl sugar amidotransferase
MAHLDLTQPPFKGLRYCTRCCMPETQEGIKFDEMGICQACQSSEQKIHIDWTVRERELRRILDEAKEKAGSNYDCIVPISGGKDSTFQLHVLVKIYGMKPLAVTFSHNWFSETGWYNLQNALEKFNVDHMMFTPNRDLVNRLARRSLETIGDACWHCHAGVGAFPLQVAARFKIPLLIWGESIAESSGRASYEAPVRKFDREYFTKVSAKKLPREMVTDSISERDVAPFEVPSVEECEAVGVFGIHLGDYIFWDDERQTEFVRDTYGWRETEIEGSYKRYKSAECIMPGVHDFTNYLKRGYGRGTFHASVDVRNGLLSREEGFELASETDSIRPEALDYFLEITGMSEGEFYETMRRHRLAQLKDVELPVKPKDHANAERILPFPQQLFEWKDRNDPR